MILHRFNEHSVDRLNNDGFNIMLLCLLLITVLQYTIHFNRQTFTICKVKGNRSMYLTEGHADVAGDRYHFDSNKRRL